MAFAPGLRVWFVLCGRVLASLVLRSVVRYRGRIFSAFKQGDSMPHGTLAIYMYYDKTMAPMGFTSSPGGRGRQFGQDLGPGSGQWPPAPRRDKDMVNGFGGGPAAARQLNAHGQGHVQQRSRPLALVYL